jgi:hypothetical protein
MVQAAVPQLYSWETDTTRRGSESGINLNLTLRRGRPGAGEAFRAKAFDQLLKAGWRLSAAGIVHAKRRPHWGPIRKHDFPVIDADPKSGPRELC